MSDTECMTTAAEVLSYRRELIEGGIPSQDADRMARDLADRLVSLDGGVRVKQYA